MAATRSKRKEILVPQPIVEFTGGGGISIAGNPKRVRRKPNKLISPGGSAMEKTKRIQDKLELKRKKQVVKKSNREEEVIKLVEPGDQMVVSPPFSQVELMFFDLV